MSNEIEGFAHRVLRVGDVKIHAVVGGEGPPVVLLHGFPQTWWEWRTIMPKLAQRHTVVALDLRGAGQSDCPQGGYDKATLADDVAGAMSALGFEQYAVCGHDIGAMVAMAVAFRHRETVTRLAILDSPIPGWSGWEANFSDPLVWHFSFHMKRDLPERLIHGREADYVSTFFADRTFNHGAFTLEDIDLYARAFAQPGNTRGGLEWYRAFPLDHANGLEWKKSPLTIPVLALGGEHRYGAKMLSMAKEFATEVSGGVIADSGHWLAEERPVETAEALLHFLAG